MIKSPTNGNGPRRDQDGDQTPPSGTTALPNVSETPLPNPFAVDAHSMPTRQVHLDNGEVLARGFLYRQIRFGPPINGVLTYNGWWFLQRLDLDGDRLWQQISWLTIQRRVEVTLPPAIRGDRRPNQIAMEFDFHRGLRFRRVRVSADGQVIYDEIN